MAQQASAGKAAPKRKPRLMKQANMNRVLYALTPVLLAAIYFYGWRVLAMTAVACMAAGITEFITSRRRGSPVSTAAFVTGALLALSLPPMTPYWIAAIGAAVGILFGKEVFGGFGRNFANPAILGRAFIYVCFPPDMTTTFVPAFEGFPAGFVHWSFMDLAELPGQLSAQGLSMADAMSQATPMWLQKNLGVGYDLWKSFLGNIGGLFHAEEQTRILAGSSVGEGSVPVLLAAGAYLIYTGTANWRLTVGMLAGVVAGGFAFNHIAGGTIGGPLFHLLNGATVYVAIFMITDPVSAPKKRPAQWIYAVLAGVLVVLLRWRSPFVDGTSFAILTVNLVGPLLDMGSEAMAARGKAHEGASREAAS